MPQIGNQKNDLSPELTVFVSTVGAPSYDECLSHLARQDCSFHLEIVDHVAPMSAAFQQMLDRCRTPYYVQVDEDMLLSPSAIRTLYEALSEAPCDVCAVARPLFDVHLERCILGIHAFRHTVTVDYPFRDVEGCEWDQRCRLEAAGYRWDEANPGTCDRHSADTLGLHGTHWTTRSIFERFATFERKRCRGEKSHEWVLEYPQVFLQRFLETGSELDLFALMGFLSGRVANHEGPGREKDFRRYEQLPGFRELQQFFRTSASKDPSVGW